MLDMRALKGCGAQMYNILKLSARHAWIFIVPKPFAALRIDERS
jgi:hypothetical protein